MRESEQAKELLKRRDEEGTAGSSEGKGANGFG